MTKTLYILYNADASLMGKLRYSYNKISKSGDECTPECAACEITHGGLSLNETARWTRAKGEIEGTGEVKVVQWHRDELSGEVKEYVNGNGLKFPLVLLDDGSGKLEKVMDSGELASFKGESKADDFVSQLKAKGVVGA